MRVDLTLDEMRLLQVLLEHHSDEMLGFVNCLSSDNKIKQFVIADVNSCEKIFAKIEKRIALYKLQIKRGL